VFYVDRCQVMSEYWQEWL